MVHHTWVAREVGSACGLAADRETGAIVRTLEGSRAYRDSGSEFVGDTCA